MCFFRVVRVLESGLAEYGVTLGRLEKHYRVYLSADAGGRSSAQLRPPPPFGYPHLPRPVQHHHHHRHLHHQHHPYEQHHQLQPQPQGRMLEPEPGPYVKMEQEWEQEWEWRGKE